MSRVVSHFEKLVNQRREEPDVAMSILAPSSKGYGKKSGKLCTMPMNPEKKNRIMYRMIAKRSHRGR